MKTKIVRRFERLDFSKVDLAKPDVTPEGYWKLDGKVARTGIQEYRDGMGNVRREMRRVDEVKASVDGFALTPLTNGHPPTLVSPDTAHRYVAGAVGQATYQDGWVKAPITVWTKDAIDAIKAGRAQLSVGYSCEVVSEPGEYEGQKYDSWQRNIKVNHVALVDTARAGPEARLRLDEGDAACGLDDPENSVIASTHLHGTHTETAHMAYKIKVDGLDLEVADAATGHVIERAIKDSGERITAQLASEKDRADSAEKARAKAEKDRDEHKVEREKLDSTIKAMDAKMVKCDECDGAGKCDGCGGTGKVKAADLMDDAKRAAAIGRIAAKHAVSLVALYDRARPVVPTNFKLDGKSPLDIKREMVRALTDKAVHPTLDSQSEVQLDSMLLVLEPKAKAKTQSAADQVRPVVDSSTQANGVSHAETDPEGARRAMIERSRKINSGK